MTMTTIDLPIAWKETGRRDRIVNARIVDVAPHLAHVATFAVHQRAWWPWGWVVSNVEAGASVRESGALTEGIAIERAAAFLAGKSEAEVVEALERIAKECEQ